jgi:hypothetical protein
MRWQLCAAVAIAAVVAGPARAQGSQDGNIRRFTSEPMDTNRSERIIYVPVGWKFAGPKPGRMPYDVSTATWYAQPIGSRGVLPNKVLDKADYRLESFDMTDDARVRVVMTRRATDGADMGAPQIQVTNTDTHITVHGYPQVERTAEGVRYTYVAPAPEIGFVPRRAASTSGNAERYELRFLPEREVKLPASVARKPTFGGDDIETRMSRSLPQLPAVERVAGRRIEYRKGDRAGVVVDNQEKVAGRRQEFRR